MDDTGTHLFARHPLELAIRSLTTVPPRSIAAVSLLDRLLHHPDSRPLSYPAPQLVPGTPTVPIQDLSKAQHGDQVPATTVPSHCLRRLRW